MFPVGEGESAPAWVAFDRKVLNFSGYFQENVNITKNDEQFRIRKVKVYFYLEDDSVQVNEPQIENSGIPQGKQAIFSFLILPSNSRYLDPTSSYSPSSTKWPQVLHCWLF